MSDDATQGLVVKAKRDQSAYSMDGSDGRLPSGVHGLAYALRGWKKETEYQ